METYLKSKISSDIYADFVEGSVFFGEHTTFLHVLVVYSAGLAKPAGLAMEIFNSLEERATDKEICVGREGLPYRNGRQWWKCQVGHNLCLFWYTLLEYVQQVFATSPHVIITSVICVWLELWS